MYDEDNSSGRRNYLRDPAGLGERPMHTTTRDFARRHARRKDETEIRATRYLGEALIKLNPGLRKRHIKRHPRDHTADGLTIAAPCQSREIQSC